ncbi:hypothetical protein V6N13_105037 [Hibiscus sabdariffa]|uniref:Uncharacterized protein n=2 Tax=Hibiscus sabdariffa TaxID=183260 RepID=A0ABR2SJS2_9ROSI
MEEGDGTTPFWVQTSEKRRRPSSFFLNTGILIVLLLVIALGLVLFIVPSFLSLTSKIFKPQVVKKSWDSLNLVLVLFAIICGFLSNASSKSSNANDSNTSTVYEDYSFSNDAPTPTPTPKHVPAQWSEYDHHSSLSDRSWTAYNALQRLKSSSSYPDLRRESSWMMNGDDRWRFYDDTHLYKYYTSSKSRPQNDEDTKDIAVDTQLPKVVRRKPKRSNYEGAKAKVTVRGERKEVALSEMKIKHSLPPDRSPPSKPPPPPPPPPTGRQEKRSSKGEKETGRGTKEFLISLRRKKKKERQRRVENLEEFFRLSTLPLYPPPSPPPPPPPPPPPLPPFYQSIFSSKKSKGRKHHSIPPLSVEVNNANNVEESMESGNESPINPIPPPPPPPPFKLRPWKFEVQGDFVSINSSRSDSPDSDEPLRGEARPWDSNKMGEMGGALFCGSPDVNTKADNFIARFRAGLTLEKINSVRGRSNLGPTTL